MSSINALPTAAAESSYIKNVSIYPYSANDKETQEKMYTLSTTVFNANTNNTYDRDPERSNRSILRYPDGDIACVSGPHFMSNGAFLFDMATTVSKKEQELDELEMKYYARMGLRDPFGEIAEERKKNKEKESITMCEFVEGVLINLFYNKDEGVWDIMTKNKVGADTYYTRTEYSSFLSASCTSYDDSQRSAEDGFSFVYSPQHTFAHMFIDAIGGADAFCEFRDRCNKNWVYSFVLQHSASPGTLKPAASALYLVSVQSCRPIIITDEDAGLTDAAADMFYAAFDTNPKEEKVYTISTVSSAEKTRYFDEWLVQFHVRLPTVLRRLVPSELSEMINMSVQYGIDSVFIHSQSDSDNSKNIRQTIKQTVVLSPGYMERKKLRGNDPNMMYMCLRILQAKDDWVAKEFLIAFPWFENLFKWTSSICQLYVRRLYTLYVRHYIHRKDAGERYPPAAHYHMKQLHNLYLEAKESMDPIVMSMDTVFTYVNGLTVKELYAAVTESGHFFD